VKKDKSTSLVEKKPSMKKSIGKKDMKIKVHKTGKSIK